MADVAVDLTDDQIERLLLEAEARLSAKQSGQNEQSLTTTQAASKTEIVKTSSQGLKQVARSTGLQLEPKSTSSEKLSVRVPQPQRSKKEKVCRLTSLANPLPILDCFHDEIISHIY